MADAAAAAAAFTAEGLPADSLFQQARRAELAKRAKHASEAELAKHAVLAKRAQQGSDAVLQGEHVVTGLQGEASNIRFDMPR